MTTSTASAVWEGKLKDGKGSFRAGSSAFNGPFTFATRFAGAKGTNPEELIAAAYAGCLAMALSADLEKAGKPATRIETRAAVTMDTSGGGPRISRIELTIRGKVQGIDQAGFQKAAEGAKNNCPVSQALAATIERALDAKLE
jgi:osmotically inducible protein OsmC